MLMVLDQQTSVIHLSYKHTHFVLCGVYRVNRRDGRTFKRVKKPPCCLTCIALREREPRRVH